MNQWNGGFNSAQALLNQFGSPLHTYNMDVVKERAEAFNGLMGGVDVKNYFAVKALPNPHILKALYDLGMGMDCSSPAELKLVEMAGIPGDQIIYSSNNTIDEDFNRAAKAGAIINFDDVSQVDRFIKQYDETLPIACCRYNPGDIEFEGVNEDIIGKPSNAKYGMPKDHIIESFKLLQASGMKRFGLHTMLLSNELNYENHIKIARLMFELAFEISEELGINVELIDLGGGFGVAYNPDQSEFNVEGYGASLADLYKEMGMDSIGSPTIVLENGRWVTSDAGFLLTKVINKKDTHKVYLGVDATMADLMRPGMYGAYHHVTIVSDRPAFNAAETQQVDVSGSLCENNDKFAIDRMLPKSEPGDIAIIHNSGAHGHAMGFQYNGMLRHAEVMISDSIEPKMIRRSETLDDYLATIISIKE